jgi:hypothetical protein
MAQAALGNARRAADQVRLDDHPFVYQRHVFAAKESSRRREF